MTKQAQVNQKKVVAITLGVIFGLIIVGVVFVVFFLSGNVRSGKISDGMVFYLNQDKDGYYVGKDKSSDTTNIVVPETFKNKPVIGIKEKGFISSSITSITLPNTIKYVAPDAFGYSEDDDYYNMNSGGYYLGNDENPYLVLVYINNAASTVADGCKVIAGNAIGKDVGRLSIPKTVEYISPAAFASVENRCYKQNGILEDSGLVSITVDKDNAYYTSRLDLGIKRDENLTYEESSMLLNKEETRLIYVTPNTLMVPDTVEFCESYAFGNPNYGSAYTYIHNLVGTKEAYIASESNPNFIQIGAPYAANGSAVTIKDGVKIIASSVSGSGSYILPDSVVQILPGAFVYGTSVTASTGGWFNNLVYLDGMAYDMVLSATNADKEIVYLKRGDYDIIEKENLNNANFETSDFRRYN